VASEAAGRAAGEGEPGAVGLEDAVEVGGGEEVMRGGAGAAHRLLVEAEEAGPLGGARLRSRDQVEPVARLEVAADLAAVAGTALRRQRRVGDLDQVALAGAAQRRRAEPVAQEDADQAGGAPVDRGRIERGRIERG